MPEEEARTGVEKGEEDRRISKHGKFGVRERGQKLKRAV